VECAKIYVDLQSLEKSDLLYIARTEFQQAAWKREEKEKKEQVIDILECLSEHENRAALALRIRSRCPFHFVPTQEEIDMDIEDLRRKDPRLADRVERCEMIMSNDDEAIAGEKLLGCFPREGDALTRVVKGIVIRVCRVTQSEWLPEHIRPPCNGICSHRRPLEILETLFRLGDQRPAPTARYDPSLNEVLITLHSPVVIHGREFSSFVLEPRPCLPGAHWIRFSVLRASGYTAVMRDVECQSSVWFDTDGVMHVSELDREDCVSPKYVTAEWRATDAEPPKRKLEGEEDACDPVKRARV
jgi:hypothetical protein